MRCPNCRRKLRKNARYCTFCGTEIEKTGGARLLSVILIVVLLIGIAATGLAAWKLATQYYEGKTPSGSSANVKISSAEEAIEHAKKLGAELGYENTLSELTQKHTTTIDGSSYYRLQQQFDGIPVYGRSVVYVTDEKGMLTSVTGNALDVSNAVKLVPSITYEEAATAASAYFYRNYGIEGSNQGSSSGLAEDLYIYNMDGEARLVYVISIGGYEAIVDAHTAEVISISQTVMAGSIGNSDTSSNSKSYPWKNTDGTYILRDYKRNIYIYDAGGNTYWDINNAGKLDPSVLTLVSSQDDVFGNEDDNTETASTAVSFLQALSSVYDYYNDEHNLNEPGFGVIAGIYNDTLGVYEGENAGGGILLVDASLPATPPDYSREDYAGEIGVIIMGSAYNDDFLSAMDSIGHEYTHFVTRRYVDWCHSFVVNKETNELYETYDENGAIDEALSDIFGELIEFDVRGETDWAHGKRTIYDPTINGYPNSAKHEVERNEKGWVVLGVLTDYAHGYSTVISHAAYLMWHGGEFLDSSKRLSETELAKLWYRAMLTMPSDCDFVECRTLVELAASTMGLTDLQMQCVSEAFDAVGIPRASENEYSQLVHLAVEGSTSIKGTAYEVKTVGGQETVVPVPKAIVTVYSGNSGKPYKECNMDNSDGFFKLELPAGAYSVVVSADGYIAETITLELAENEVRYLSIELAPQSSAVTTGAYEAYLRAAQKTTASGSWSEKLSTTADMTLSKGSATTRTQTTLTSDAAISGYSEGDLSKLQISGFASMDAMGQTYAWTMEYSNGTAHYRYTEPVPTTAELEIAPNFFSFNTIASDMMTNAALSGNQITFVVPGEALTKAGLAAVDQMNGFDDLSYGDADVVVQLSTEGKIDTIAMAFHASMEYQGYDADMDFVINYGFSEYVAPAPTETVSITPGFYAQEDDPNNILTIHEVSGSRVTFSVLWYRLWGINNIEATKSGNSASFHYTEPNNKELWAEGTLAFSEDTVVLTLTDCTNPYVDTGEYRFNLIGVIFSDEQLKEISYELGVPENLDTKITQGEPAYWEGGDMYRTPIEVYYNGEFIAGASVNSLTGDLAGNIYVYDAASHSVSDSAGAFDIASTFGYSKAWEIHDYVGEDHMVTTLAFQEDGTFYGGTGWYLSDWFVCFTGTYSVDDDVLMLRYTLNGEDRIASYQVEWDDHALKQTSEEGLVLEHQKGTELPFLESTSLTAESLQRQVALFSKLAEGGYDG